MKLDIRIDFFWILATLSFLIGTYIYMFKPAIVSGGYFVFVVIITIYKAILRFTKGE